MTKTYIGGMPDEATKKSIAAAWRESVDFFERLRDTYGLAVAMSGLTSVAADVLAHVDSPPLASAIDTDGQAFQTFAKTYQTNCQRNRDDRAAAAGSLRVGRKQDAN